MTSFDWSINPGYYALMNLCKLIAKACLYCFLLAASSGRAQEEQSISFLEIEDGLFNKWISCIAQDEKGFVWVGTQDGLHRYDGYSFEVLRNSAEDIQSLSANWIRDITLDNNDNYWLGTYGGGLIKFSPKKMSFKSFVHEQPKESAGTIAYKSELIDNQQIVSSTDKGFQIHEIKTNAVRSLGLGYFDSPMTSSGKILWLTENEKLFTYNLETEETKQIHNFESRINMLKYLPRTGLIVGLDNELVLFQKGQLTKRIPIDNSLVSVIPDKKGNYIVATFKSLLKLDAESFRLEPIYTDLNLANLHIQTIFLDRQNSLWIGTGKGLFKEKKYHSAFNRKGIDVHARRIIKHKKTLYLGGDHGIYKVNDHGTLPTLVMNNRITAMFDQDSVLLATADKTEIYKFRNDSLYHTISGFSRHKDLVTYGLTKDHKQRLWVGSWEGIYVLDSKDHFLKFIPLETDYENSDAKIINLHLDAKDRLWIITAAYGIYRIDGISIRDLSTSYTRIKNYRNNKEDPHSITSNILMTMEEDTQGQMWFGTDLGVVKYNEDTKDFTRLQYQNKLFDKKVMSLRQDSDQNLWISTINDGLYVYADKENTIRHFTKDDGLISDAFLFGSGFYDATNKHLYFGTDEGVQIIDPSKLSISKKKYTPLITAIQVNDVNGKNAIPVSQAPFLEQIALEDYQNDFSVRFSALDFITPKKIRYSYSLDDNPWKMTDLQTAYFTNIPYGNHTLKVKALYDGIGSNRKITTLNIHIRPPWYLSSLAKAMYLLMLLVLVWGIYLYLKWRWKMRFDLKLKEEEAERFKKLHDFKSKLYTDIAHEFKTPLTLIAGPVDDKLRERNISERDHTNFSMVQRNADRLTSLVDQLLQLAKLESGKLDLKLAPGKLDLFLMMLAKSFEYKALPKKIVYQIDIPSFDQVWYDEDIIEKIATNLLSNAFKYTPDGGKCWFRVKKEGEFIEINVRNTVQNGPELQLNKLFSRFYQSDAYAEGMGVGLALVKELVTLYGGTVMAEMKEEEIIDFRVSLPCECHGFQLKAYGPQANSQSIPDEQSACFTNKENLIAKTDRPILLIVEDQSEIRDFVKYALQKDYRVIEAKNGKEGTALALAQVPDVILSDIKMPVMSGIELCHVLKNDERTSHIPIILLTGSSQEGIELKGLDSGADDFVSKPFKIRLLQKRITNLIKQRRLLRDKYSKELILKPKEIAITPADENFLNKVQIILDAHLSDPSFNSFVFSEKANMSRMQLHRKLLVYTGLSTSAFIRSQRLKQALRILETPEVTINEVAYLSGFNSPTYFMTCFKETFKKTPSEYLQSLQD